MYDSCPHGVSNLFSVARWWWDKVTMKCRHQKSGPHLQPWLGLLSLTFLAPGNSFPKAHTRTEKGELVFLMLTLCCLNILKINTRLPKNREQTGVFFCLCTPKWLDGEGIQGVAAPSWVHHQDFCANQMRWHLRQGLVNESSLMKYSSIVFL